MDAQRPPLERFVRRSGLCRSGCQPLAPTTRIWYHSGTTGVRSELRASGIRLCITGLVRNHAQHTITLPITGNQHHGRAYHTGTTSLQHNEPSYHTLHHGRLHDGASTTRLQDTRFAISKTKREWQSRSPDAERSSSADASAPRNVLKNRTISCAKRSAGTTCSALRSLSFGVSTAWADHICTGSHRHDGRSVALTRIGDHALHNGPRSVPRTSGITLPITGTQHNGPSYHALHHGQSAQRAVVPRRHNELSAQRALVPRQA